MTRTAVYVDGGPFMDAVRQMGMSMDMDLMALLKELASDADIVAAHYITAEYPKFPYPAKHRNEKQRLEKFASQGITIHCCQPQIIGSIFVDRGVEALMTTSLIVDAVTGAYETALIVSRRGELSPAIKAVKDLGRTIEVAHFKYDLDPVNPLDAFADKSTVITIDQVIARRISGPKPPALTSI